jgi:hypothetical protein
MTIPNEQIGSSQESKLLRYILKQVDGLMCQICNLMDSLAGATDEKVKYDVGDPTAGYLSDKMIAGPGIVIDEGVGADVNKVRVSATCECIEYLIVSQEEPVNPIDGLLWYNPDLCLTTTTTTLAPPDCPEGSVYSGWMTVGSDYDGSYGYYEGVYGSLNPITIIAILTWGGITLVLRISDCQNPVVYIDGVEFSGLISGGGNDWLLENVLVNPFAAVGELSSICVVCGETTTTTTTIAPTTTTTTTLI